MSARITLAIVIFSVCAFFMMGQEQQLPKAAVVYGIDVSHFQGEINWDQVKQNKPKITFAFIKATEASDEVDTQFESNWNGAKRAGILRGAYHFFDAKSNPKAQADLFINTVKKLQENDLPPWLDLESGKFSETDEVAKKNFVNNVFTWLEEVEDALGARPLIYASPDFASEYLTDERFGDYSLVVAEYGMDSDAPRMLGAWQGKTWAFWQYFPQRLVKGITEKTDLDKFNGTAQALLKFTKSSSSEKKIAYADLEKEKALARGAVEKQEAETTELPEEESPDLKTVETTEETAAAPTEKASPELKQWQELPALEEINIGKTRFPRDFIFKRADYKKGVYQVKLTWKEGHALPYFDVYDSNEQLLFTEMALVIDRGGKTGKFKPRIKKTLLPGSEYFMIKVTKPDQYLYAFFLVKTAAKK